MQAFFKSPFGLTLLLALLAVTTMALPVTETDLVKKSVSFYDLLKALKVDSNGIVSLGSDGVLRSFCHNKTVLAYEKLNPQQIQQSVEMYGRTDHLTKAFEGVNGETVVDLEQLINPGKDLLPADYPLVKPRTSENPALDKRNKLPDVPSEAPSTCAAPECYGPGNCDDAEYCIGCYVPYPGVVGHCY